MGSGPSDSIVAFDLKVLRQLVKLMNDNDLAELDLRNDTQRIRLRKLGAEVVSTTVPNLPALAGERQAPAQASASSTNERKEAKSELVEIKSPMLGTFYRANAPDAEPFVQIGSHVEHDTVVCIVEAMKVFNEIPAETHGKVVAILVENGQPVEYGQSLYRVDPTG